MEGKKSRINNNTDLVVDRISDLPDSLLGHILSFLTNTDEAVTTSVLWTTPAEVPRCLSNSLKKVVIDGYKGYEDERETVRYMLEHGSVLEVVKISCGGFSRDNRKLKLLKEICKFPRKSPVCEVEFL